LYYKRVVLITAVLILLASQSGLAGTVDLTLGSGSLDTFPAPRLRYPINETAVLTGNDPLEFKWWNDFTEASGYTFKLYQGYNMYAANLIYREDLPADVSSVKVSSDLFKDGQVYTWSLIRISFRGYKSDRSFNSFRVIRR